MKILIETTFDGFRITDDTECPKTSSYIDRVAALVRGSRVIDAFTHEHMPRFDAHIAALDRDTVERWLIANPDYLHDLDTYVARWLVVECLVLDPMIYDIEL